MPAQPSRPQEHPTAGSGRGGGRFARVGLGLATVAAVALGSGLFAAGAASAAGGTINIMPSESVGYGAHVNVTGWLAGFTQVASQPVQFLYRTDPDHGWAFGHAETTDAQGYAVLPQTMVRTLQYVMQYQVSGVWTDSPVVTVTVLSVPTFVMMPSVTVPYRAVVNVWSRLSVGSTPLAGRDVMYLARTDPDHAWVFAHWETTNGDGYAVLPQVVSRTLEYGAYFPGDASDSAAGAPYTTVAVSTASTLGEQIVAYAAQFAGDPYVYGGASPSGFDCSGFTMYVWGHFGYSLPHNAQAQYDMPGMQHLPQADAQPGDFIFFYEGGYVYHVGIYAGDNYIWAANHPGGGVVHEQIWTSAYVVGWL